MQIQSFALPKDQTYDANAQLAKQIIAKSDNNIKVKDICSDNFLMNPTDHLIYEMVTRGVGRCRTDDHARAFVMGEIPGFIEKATSPYYLRAFATKYFFQEQNQSEIMKIFEKSLSNHDFQKKIKSAIKNFETANNNEKQEKFQRYNVAENSLRIALTIFNQSAMLNEYVTPKRIRE